MDLGNSYCSRIAPILHALLSLGDLQLLGILYVWQSLCLPAARSHTYFATLKAIITDGFTSPHPVHGLITANMRGTTHSHHDDEFCGVVRHPWSADKHRHKFVPAPLCIWRCETRFGAIPLNGFGGRTNNHRAGYLTFLILRRLCDSNAEHQRQRILNRQRKLKRSEERVFKRVVLFKQSWKKKPAASGRVSERVSVRVPGRVSGRVPVTLSGLYR